MLLESTYREKMVLIVTNDFDLQEWVMNRKEQPQLFNKVPVILSLEPMKQMDSRKGDRRGLKDIISSQYHVK